MINHAYMPIIGTPFAVRLDVLNERQALRNHSQSLEQLKERGGLSWCEAAAVAGSRPWRSMTDTDAIEELHSVAAMVGISTLPPRAAAAAAGAAGVPPPAVGPAAGNAAADFNTRPE